MTPGEKAQILQWVARDLGDAFPGNKGTGEKNFSRLFFAPCKSSPKMNSEAFYCFFSSCPFVYSK
jgi:hypothetical protein